MLEQMAFDNGLSTQLVRPKPQAAQEYDFEPVHSPQQETLDCLCELYSLLKEEDMLVGIWQKRAKFQVGMSYDVLTTIYCLQISRASEH